MNSNCSAAAPTSTTPSCLAHASSSTFASTSSIAPPQAHDDFATSFAATAPNAASHCKHGLDCGAGIGLGASSLVAAPALAVPLPTGEKVYHLKVVDVQRWNTDTTEAFSKFLNLLAEDKGVTDQLYYNDLNKPAQSQRLGHEVLAQDGFILGEFLFCGKDQDVHPSKYALFKRLPSRSAAPVAGEYVALLFSNSLVQKSMKGPFFLEMRVMCLFLPPFMPHISRENFSLIGKGSFGAAFRISYDSISDPVQRLTCVIKRVDINQKSFKLIMRESWFLRHLRHPNIAHLLHQYVSPHSAPSKTDPRDPTTYFVQEDCGQTLHAYICSRYLGSQSGCSVVTVQTIERFLRGLLSALVFLQRFGVLHRDIKADNVMVVEDRETGGITAKLIDFGLAKKLDCRPSNASASGSSAAHEEDGDKCNEAVAALKVSSASKASAAAPARAPFKHQSKLFRVGKQYAPETWLDHQYDFDSDLWAVGTMILWPLLYVACERNLLKDSSHGDNIYNYLQQHSPFEFPFEALWGSKEPGAYDEALLSELIKRSLKDNYIDAAVAAPGESAPQPSLKVRFEKLCDICKFMCAHNPKERKMNPDSSLSAAQQCLEYLGDVGQPMPDDGAGADRTFDSVCKFIDNFCASGHYRASAEFKSSSFSIDGSAAGPIVGQTFDTVCKFIANSSVHYRASAEFKSSSFRIEFKWHHSQQNAVAAVYALHPDRSWLWRVQPVPSAVLPLAYEDCLTPEFCVLPQQEHMRETAQPRAVFLPRDKFCCGADGRLDVQFLTLLSQTDWFTVFRFERPHQPNWIIKHTSVNSVTFKYLLQEKVLFRYLRHHRIANEIEGFQDFHPLVMYTHRDAAGCEKSFTGNDRFVIYEDGGRPIDIQLLLGWQPSFDVVHSVARQLVEVLTYLQSKGVVHRKLELGTVVINTETREIKLISLGEAKYIEPLNYESKILTFEDEWRGVLATVAKDCSARSRSPSPPPLPKPVTSLDSSMRCAHPSLSEPQSSAPHYSHDWYSAGKIIEFLLSECSDLAAATQGNGKQMDVQTIVDCLKSGDLKCCQDMFDIKSAEIEPISDSDKALLSFTQSLLRRRFHDSS